MVARNKCKPNPVSYFLLKIGELKRVTNQFENKKSKCFKNDYLNSIWIVLANNQRYQRVAVFSFKTELYIKLP